MMIKYVKKVIIKPYILVGSIIKSLQYSLIHSLQTRNKKSRTINNISSVLFITNDNGGGTRKFERNFIGDKKVTVLRRIGFAEGHDIIYELYNNDDKQSIFLYKEELSIVFKRSYEIIYVNSLVNYTKIKWFLDELITYKNIHKKCKMIYFIHDYHAVCPRYMLFSNGHSCNMNCSKEQCNYRYTKTKIDISNWRCMWGRFLENIDEIRCFSYSSKKVIQECYESIQEDKITVEPHDTSYIDFTPIIIDNSRPMHIGIIGDCRTEAKGHNVVSELINRYGDIIPITVIGPWYISDKKKKKKVKYYGPYEQEKLKSIISDEKITIIVFPSLWMETFSYLVSELIALKLPIIGFNIGAQAEKLKAYEEGILFEKPIMLYEYLNEIIMKETDKK